MCGTHLGSVTRKARKEHRCAACRTPIPAGRSYTISSDVADGKAHSEKWHVECFVEFQNMLREQGEDCGDPYSTWESGDLPFDVKKQYQPDAVADGEAK